MLRKRGRPAQKEQTMGDSFFNLPGLFVGYGKNSGDSDSARSPISPLDFKVFSGVGSHFCRSPRSPGRSRKSWDSDRVGLGLIDSLSDRSSQMKLRIISVSNPKLFDFSASSPRSLPKNYVISSHDWEKNQTQNENQRQCSGSFSACEIEQSEDYTCIISHGPNPKMTRIFGDCVLESHEDLGSFEKQDEVGVFSWMLDCAEDLELIPLPSKDFLSVCYSCKKKLDGEDIYMYRYYLVDSFNGYREMVFTRIFLQGRESILQQQLQNSGDHGRGVY